MKKILYEFRGILLSYDDDKNYIVEMEDSPKLLQAFENPLVAWTCFADIVDSRARKHMKEMPSLRGELYRIREVSMCCTSKGVYFVEIDTEAISHGPFFTPLEAWVFFMNIVDCRVRCRIGDMLEAQGRNRYTGELHGEK